MSKFILSGFSDEIDTNIDIQFKNLKELNMEYFEPRGINGKNISTLTEKEADMLKEKMNEYGIKASQIGSPIGKIKLTDNFDEHFETFKNVVKIAKKLDCRYIRVFSFYHDGGEWQENERAEVFEKLSKMIDYAKQNDVVLMHENEKDIYGDTADRCLDLMENLYCDNFKFVFDPANFVQCGVCTKDAYKKLNQYIAYMHIKDADAEGKVVPAGYGVGNVEYILTQLKEKGYSGFLSLEPHLGDFSGFEMLEGGVKPDNLEKSDAEKFKIAYRALNKITDKLKNTKTIKMGVIGYGNMGSTHCANIADGKVPGMELTAICDVSESRRETAQKKHPGVKGFDNAENLFKSGLCDSVLIAVPHYMHPELVVKAFENNLNVITEKPAGVYTKQVMDMNTASEKTDKLFGIMYNQRTNPVYQKLRDMIKGGELGKIKRITWIITDWYRTQAYHDSSTWRSTWKNEGGGALINQNPHQLDLWQWMFGMPDRVYSKVSFGKYRDIEVEDDVMAYFEYDNGTSGEYITSTGEAPGTNRLEVACDMGKIVIENNKMTFYKNDIAESEFNKINTEPFGAPKTNAENIDVDFSGGEQHIGILKDFANVLTNGGTLLAPGKDGIFGLTISNAIHLSAWTGKTVETKNFPHNKFYKILRKKIKQSTVVKKEAQVIANTEGTY